VLAGLRIYMYNNSKQQVMYNNNRICMSYILKIANIYVKHVIYGYICRNVYTGLCGDKT
jgi:hypothetical protein